MARVVLGHDGFTQPRDQGQALTLKDPAAHTTRRGSGRKRPTACRASLTPAEPQVARLVGQGLHNQAIAQQLFIAPGTQDAHLH
jgi:DNA-binding NarL/FixJ family response regulator